MAETNRKQPQRIGPLIGQAMAGLRQRQQEASVSLSASTRPDKPPGPDIPSRYAAWRLEDYPPAITARLGTFFARQVWSVYLCGAVGTRKTSIAAAVLRRWRALGLPSNGGFAYGEFVTPDRFVDACRDFEGGKSRLEAWRTAPILVLDDIGAFRSTPHIVESLLLFIGCRYNRDLSTIATSNCGPAELAQQIDARIASRFQDGVLLDLGHVDTRAASVGSAP